jgi:hypothetical protein
LGTSISPCATAAACDGRPRGRPGRAAARPPLHGRPCRRAPRVSCCRVLPRYSPCSPRHRCERSTWYYVWDVFTVLTYHFPCSHTSVTSPSSRRSTDARPAQWCRKRCPPRLTPGPRATERAQGGARRSQSSGDSGRDSHIPPATSSNRDASRTLVC